MKTNISWPGPRVPFNAFVAAYRELNADEDIALILDRLRSGDWSRETAVRARRGVQRRIRCLAHELLEKQMGSTPEGENEGAGEGGEHDRSP